MEEENAHDKRSGGIFAPLSAGGGWSGGWWGCRTHGPVERAIADLPLGDGLCPDCGRPLRLTEVPEKPETPADP